jgi:hypothetical protein
MPHHSTRPTDNAGKDPAVFAYRHLRGLMGQALAFFSEHESDNLNRVRAHLLELADARPSMARMQNLRSAGHVLKQHAETFNRSFQDALKVGMEAELKALLPEMFSAHLRSAAPVEPSDDGDLTLVDLGAVERVLLIDRVTQRFNARYGISVGALTLRLGTLLAGDALANNPFRPEVFVRAFLTAWETCEFDAQATEDLMLSLDPLQFVDLSGLYDDLNATLIGAGIEARVVHRIRKSEGGVSGFSPMGADSTQGPLTGSDTLQRRSELAPLDAVPAAPSAWQALVPAGRQMAVQARQFLRRLGLTSPAAPVDAGDSEMPVWMDADSDAARRQSFAPADPELMGYLGGLQAGAGAASKMADQEWRDPGEQNILRQVRERDEVRRAPELDRGTVDALAEVFDFVFADQAIPPQMKYVIGRLQIPVLKAAMIDRDFFLEDDHPARRLVDTLASASVQWAPEKGEEDPLYQRIENTVMRVLNEFEDDLALFSELLQEFTEFLFETEQQVQVRIEPATNDELAGESYEQALAHADEVIAQHIQASEAQLKAVPFLTPFLTHAWRDVLARAWLTVHGDPAPWDRAIATMAKLIWSTQPKIESEERRQLVAILPDLVRQLNAGLDGIEWAGDARVTFTRRLIATHMLAIRLAKPTAIDTETAALHESASQEAMQALDQRRAGKLAGASDDFDAVAQGFSRGLWFDFLGASNLKQRCRLSWISPLRTRFLFTNRDGFDAFVRSEREVAALLRRGELHVIDQEPIVSRALERLMSQAEIRQAD